MTSKKFKKFKFLIIEYKIYLNSRIYDKYFYKIKCSSTINSCNRRAKIKVLSATLSHHLFNLRTTSLEVIFQTCIRNQMLSDNMIKVSLHSSNQWQPC